MRRIESSQGSAGITLVEILAVIAIMVLLVIMAIPALNLWRSQSVLKHAAKTVKSMLDEARGMAIARGQEFTVDVDTAEESMIIKDNAGAPASKKWLSPAGVDITDVSGSGGTTTFRFKTDGGCSVSKSIHLKRRDAKDSEISKYYTVTVINTTGVSKIYGTKENP